MARLSLPRWTWTLVLPGSSDLPWWWGRRKWSWWRDAQHWSPVQMHQQLCLGLVFPKYCLCTTQTPLIETNRAGSVSQEGGSAEKRIWKSLGSSSFPCRCTFKQRREEGPSRGWRGKKSNLHQQTQGVGRKVVIPKFPVPVPVNQKPPKVGVLHRAGLLTPIKRQAALPFQPHLDFPAQFEMALLPLLLSFMGPGWSQG